MYNTIKPLFKINMFLTPFFVFIISSLIIGEAMGSGSCRIVGDNPVAEKELAAKANIWQHELKLGLKEVYPEAAKVRTFYC
jgi:hypothetical protein